MGKAEEIREDMRERAREQLVRVAQATAERSLNAICALAQPLRFASTLTREDVQPVVSELLELVKLLEEALPSLPGDNASEEKAA